MTPDVEHTDTRVLYVLTPGCHTYRDPGVVQTSLAKKESLSFDKKDSSSIQTKKRRIFPFSPTNKAFPKPHLFQVNKHLTIG